MSFLKNNQKIILLLLVGLVLRVFLGFFGTLSLDQNTFIAWSASLAGNGFKNFYNGWSDYFPGYLYILWILGKINFVPQVLLYKLPAIISDVLTSFLIFKILQKSKSIKWGLIGAAVYMFNPAVLTNSALWGQVDSLTALLSIISIYQFPYSVFWSAAALSFGTLIKPQTAFVFPVILFLFIRDKRKFTDLLIYCFIGLMIFVLGFVPFWNHGSLITFIIERLGISLNQYPYTSVNAFNFWGVFGFWQKDNLVMQMAGYLVVLSIIIITFIIFIKKQKQKNIEYFFVSLIFAATFTFFTRMHERHLLPVFAPLTIAMIENPGFLLPYVLLSLTYLLNLYYSYIWITQDFKEIFSAFFAKILGVINIFSTGLVFSMMLVGTKVTWNKIKTSMNRIIELFTKNNLLFGNSKVKIVNFPKIKLTDKKAKYILYLILGFAFITRVFDLNLPSTMYFDEVYHAFTAKVILSSDVTRAWEWWNTPPQGFAYEWTHPPLAKLGMAIGMLIFGQNSFGWRIPGAILGVGVVYLVYLLSKEIFKDEVIGLLSSAAFSLDGLPLVMSRIGMNDSYILFFVLLSIYLYLKDKNLFSALSFGLALSSKWSAIWAVPIFGIIFLSQKKKINLSYIWFFILPPLVYLGSYFDMFLTGHDLATWWGMQQQMWWYHTGLRATHPYSSMWWEWPFLVRPIYLYTSNEVNGMVSRIYDFGNPFVFWFGLSSVILCIIYAYIERNKKLGLIVFSYLVFFVPWALSPRIMFLYHYLPSIPFMAIAIGYVLRRNLKMIPYFFIPAAVLFIYFFPHYIGMKIPLWLDTSYYWFTSWR